MGSLFTFHFIFSHFYTVKPVLNGHSKQTKKLGWQDQLSLNADQKYCRKLQRQHSAILLTFIKLPFAIKTIVLSILERPLTTCFTVTIILHKTCLFHCDFRKFQHLFCQYFWSTKYCLLTMSAAYIQMHSRLIV